jgi:hypothetical protein
MQSQRGSFRRAAQALALAGLLGLLGLAGCTTAQMSSAPLWDRPASQAGGGATIAAPQDRVNVWPLYYYNYGTHAMSALWPLVAMTDDAHEAIPFYTWYRPETLLRLGVVHPFLLPSLATVDRDDDYWRVLTVVKDQDELQALPVIYRNEKGFWTLPYTQFDDGDEHFKGAIGPLFWSWSNGDHRLNSHPFPLVWSGWGKGGWGAAVFPVFMTLKGSEYFDSWTNVGLVLANWQRKGEDYDLAYLAWLGGMGREGDRRYNRLIPLWYYAADPRASSFYSLPYVATRQGDESLRVALLNLYWDQVKGPDRTTGLLWPVYMGWSRPAHAGHWLMPLYYYDRTADGSRTLYTLPYSVVRDGQKRMVGFGALYYRSEARDRVRGAALFPLSAWWRNPDGAGSYVLPLYYANRDDEGRWSWQTPLAGVHRSADSTSRNVLFPLYYASARADGRRAFDSALWPLFMRWRADDRSTHALLPLFVYTREADDSSWFSLLYSQGAHGERRFQNLGTILYGRYSTSNSVRWWALLGAAGYGRNRRTDSFDVHLFPLIGYERTTAMSDYYTLLYWRWRTLQSREAIEQDLTDRFLDSARRWRREHPDSQQPFSMRVQSEPLLLRGYPWLLFSKFESSLEMVQVDADDPAASRRVDVGEDRFGLRFVERSKANIPLLYRSDVRPGIDARTDILTLLYRSRFNVDPEGERHGSQNLLWRLYDGRSTVDADGTVHSERRVLWRVWDRVRDGDRVATDLFPFIALDRGPERWKFSFAGGLLGYERRGGSRQARFLWIPIGALD